MLDSLSSDELQFIKAIEKYKKEQGKLFLSWTEVLHIVKDLGYKKVARPESTPPKAPKGSRSPKRRKAQATEKAPEKENENENENETETTT